MQTTKVNDLVEKPSLSAVSVEGLGYFFAIAINIALSIMFSVIG